MVCDVPSEAKCPLCAAFAVDEEGLRVAYCANCGRCDHPSAARLNGRLACNACGRELEEPAAVQVFECDGEPD